MNKITIVPDSFKGTMSSSEVCRIMKKAITDNYPNCEVISCPVADGGEGTVNSFLEAVGGSKITISVTGPFLTEKVKASYAMLPGNTAVIEMAEVASLPMVEGRKNPSTTTTCGVGELMVDAVKRGAVKLIIALGGSCTNDAAAGLLSACGARFIGADGIPFLPVGKTLKDIKHVDATLLQKRFSGIDIEVMCDIDNPFRGIDGAAYVYGPQKGADLEMVQMLDAGMSNFSKVVFDDLGVDIDDVPGAGAAGGMGGGLHAFFRAPLRCGIEILLDTVCFEEIVKESDFVFTGEGKIDSQSIRGKVIKGVSSRAKKAGIKTVCFVGDIGDDIESIYNEGIVGIFSINRVALPYSEVRNRAEKDLYLTVDNVMKFYGACN